MLSVANNLMETRQPLPQVNDSNQLEDIQLIARARAVGIQYEFAHPGVQESEDDRRKRKRRNQRRVSDGERRLCAVIGDLPPPPLAGSSQLEDEAYCAIRAFEVDQMTYRFRYCDVCKERRLEGKGTGNVHSLQKR